MTDKTSLVNLALQTFGSRTTVTAAELVSETSNEAKQANLTFDNTRDSLLRMAPWDCALKTANLTYITSVPGTPENTSAVTNLWQPGQPRPPWSYEYQYPVDCLRACWIIPATQTGYAGGIPITTAVTGGASTTWLGGPISYKVATDSFFSVLTATPVNGGSGYVPNEIVTLVNVPNTIVFSNGIGGQFQIGQPQGAAPQLKVLTVNGAGAILTAEPFNIIIDGDPPTSGSLFYKSPNPVAQNYSSSDGIGATFNLGYTIQGDQRVILTNQEFATLVYVRQVTDPNIWDPLFQDAFQNALGADICMALSGDKVLANACIQRANASIAEARKADGNEGLTVNDVTPDWIRIRGVCWTDTMSNGPYSGFDWGGLLNGWA